MADHVGGSAVPLGNSTDFVSARAAAAGDRADRRARRRVDRYRLQDQAKALLPGHRVGVCRRALTPVASGVSVMYSDQAGAAHFKGLMVCGSVWVCPVCAATITERRRVELAEAVAAHPELTPVVVTVTLQHQRGDRLADLVDRLNQSWRWVQGGRVWDRLKAEYGLIGSICGAEVTWGEAAGWHPHKHVLFLSTLDRGRFNVDRFQSLLQQRYTEAVAAKGGYASPVYGLRVQVGDQAVAGYLAKWGVAEEVTKSTVKTGRAGGGLSPWDLLALAASGDRWPAADLFREYAEAMAGRSQLRWSRGLRDRLGLGAELSDAELAEIEEEKARVLAVLDRIAWAEVVRRGLRGDLLEVGRAGRRDYVVIYLAAFGIQVQEGEVAIDDS